jgi:hypothetical protein
MQSTINRQPLRGRLSGLLCAWQWLLLLALTFGAGPVWAECTSPETGTAPSGGIAVFNCAAPFGFGAVLTPPSHGSLSTGYGSETVALVYTNNGDAASSDSFIVRDDNGIPTTFNVTIQGATSPITVSPNSLPTPVIGSAYTGVALTSTGGVPQYSYSVASGSSLPPGLSLSSAGVFSGTPTGAGSYSFTVNIQDSTTPTPLTTIKSYSVAIADPVFTPSPAAPPAGAVGVAYSAQLGTAGGTAPYTYSSPSGLPNGVSLNSAGLLSGTPTANGTYTITYSVKDSTTSSAGGSYTQPQSVTFVVSSVPTVSAVSPTTGPVTGGTSVTITGTNLSGATGVSFGGTAATGFTVNSATSITATAPVGSAGTVDIAVTSAAGTSAVSAADKFTYVAPPSITSISPTSGTTGGAT